jgi:hypothetical protein
MQKPIYLVGACALAAAAIFAWSQSALVSPRITTASATGLSPVVATVTTTPAISPFEMMVNRNGALPVEQWDAF